jgi:hypothetical protein
MSYEDEVKRAESPHLPGATPDRKDVFRQSPQHAVVEGALAYLPVKAATLTFVPDGGEPVHDDGMGNLVGEGIVGGTIEYCTGRFLFRTKVIPTYTCEWGADYEVES